MAAKKKAKKKTVKRPNISNKELLDMVDERKLGKGAKVNKKKKR